MRFLVLSALAIALSPTVTRADNAAADACAAKLTPVGQEIYKTVMAENLTAADARSLIVSAVEKQIGEGKVTMSEGRAAGEAVGKCLELLE